MNKLGVNLLSTTQPMEYYGPGGQPTQTTVELVTGLEIEGHELVDFTATFATNGLFGSLNERRALLPKDLALSLEDFCQQHYLLSDYPPRVPTFDCFSALSLWMGRTQTLQLGIGVSAFNVAGTSTGRRDHLAGQAYLITDQPPNQEERIRHAYLGLGPDPEQKHTGLGRTTLSVNYRNGPLVMAPPSVLRQLHVQGQATTYNLA